ncbi:peptidoglycan editing factor PgeF [Zavarzinia sp. CC-PAN008]|uniref:peptidoglycan editing factor PgeF n=1 Tax=Zavarzinia sp. CC-PAN008 TaxID=3243332 RepID=UPI003F745755
MPWRLQAGVLGDVPHGFFGRPGGVSGGIYRSLNCGLGSDDDRAHVLENRARAAAGMRVGAHQLVTVHQVHSPDVAIVDAPWAEGQVPRADAVVTAQRGLAIAVLTADCAPVLLADPVAGVIGAAHAGWRGALAGVVEATVAAMVSLGADAWRISAAIGPCIAQESYEVGPEFRQAFVDADPENAHHFVDGPRGRPHFDLQAFVAERLAAAGVGAIEAKPQDTFREAHLFSHRASQRRGEPDYGRAASVIALKP